MRHLIPFTLAAAAAAPAAEPANYRSDVEFLRKHTGIIELTSGEAAVAIAPAYQGRVMTSTAAGGDAPGFGWLNHPLIEQGVLSPDQAKGKLEEHIHVFGGEERFWLGPEGGQFGIFFPKGSPFDFASWKTPPALDTEPFRTVKADATEAVFAAEFQVSNHRGTTFSVGVQRSIRILSREEISAAIGLELPAAAKVVAYETVNELTNRGEKPWTKDDGLLSIWLLGMYQPTPGTVVAIPVKPGDEAKLGPVVNDDYFGRVPSDRLKVKDDVIFFKGDGEHRSKIGVPPLRSLGVAGSYSPEWNALTLTLYPHPEGLTDYVNSAWAIQEKPFGGDVINSYNDGSPEPGKPPLGPFYELETSSPAAALMPGQSITHRQTTIHLIGDAATLDPVARKLLRVSTGEIKDAFATLAE
jgi:hypothetical protein